MVERGIPMHLAVIFIGNAYELQEYYMQIGRITSYLMQTGSKWPEIAVNRSRLRKTRDVDKINIDAYVISETLHRWEPDHGTV